MNITAQDLQDYYDKLEHHDWTFEYTEDYNVWRRGRTQLDTLHGLAAKHPDFDQLFRTYADHIWRGAEKPARPE